MLQSIYSHRKTDIFCESQWCLCLQSRRHLGTHMRGVTLARHRSPNLWPNSDHRYSTAQCSVPWSHYISNNCIYIQSHLLCWYKLNCNRFNDRETPIFLQHRPPATIRNFFFLWSGDCAMTLQFHVLQKIYCMKILITIYFYIWT